jgi:hypothetical protein
MFLAGNKEEEEHGNSFSKQISFGRSNEQNNKEEVLFYSIDIW